MATELAAKSHGMGNTRSLSRTGKRFRSTWQLMKSPYETYARWQQRFGKTFLINAMNGNVVATSNTENIRRVLAARHDEVSQFAIGTIAPLIGESSVALVDGQRHRRARNMLVPPFRGEALRNSVPTMAAIADQVTADWHVGDRIKVMDTSLEFSQEVIIQVVFGVQDPDRVQVFKHAINSYVKSFRPIFAFTKHFQNRWIPQWRRFLREKKAFDQLLDQQIAEQRNGPLCEGNVLSMLLKARDESGNPLDDGELRDQLVSLLFAGHETTQIAIGWAMSWLHRSPEILQRLRLELETANSLDESIRSDLLNGICHEALRLNPIVADFLRVFHEPLELEEVSLPAKSTVAILSVNVHYDPSIYANPDKFDPDRWTRQTFKPHEFLAFGGGVRRCIGASMALLEMKVAIVTWLNKFQFDLPPDAPEVEPVQRRNLTMAPRSGIQLLVSKEFGQTAR